MRRTIRKQTRLDFNTRIQRLDPKFAEKKPSERFDIKPWEAAPKKSGFRGQKPFMMAAIGAGCAITAMLCIHNPEAVKSLLLTWGWPPQFLSYAMNGIGISTVGMLFFLFSNVIRMFRPRASGRWNATGMVAGAIAGVGVFNIPEAYVDAGYALLGFQDAGDVLDFAQARTLQLANIDWTSVVMVSSDAK